MCIFLPDLPCSSYLCLCVLRFIGFLWGWHWGCWKTGASSRNKAELCVMHARRRFCFQRREDGRRELIYTQCHRREWAETQGYEANYSPCREAGVPPPLPPRGGLSGWNSERTGRKWQIQQELETDSQSHSCCFISTGCNHGYQHHQALTGDFRHPKIHFFPFILPAFYQYTVCSQ